ncbi:hypothetical protein BV22DRAFT_914860 [Leucogyrophana mollusca]|uniref:Uncharacterized protein n=1 Tax=Leucogyrophana mollusca TaxID=85980 RepID=A0ACB8AYX4_9AGAM|nr:hypothetical protein BV22DRAFT_914860 [Leucogyrophana mollusca]
MRRCPTHSLCKILLTSFLVSLSAILLLRSAYVYTRSKSDTPVVHSIHMTHRDFRIKMSVCLSDRTWPDIFKYLVESDSTNETNCFKSRLMYHVRPLLNVSHRSPPSVAAYDTTARHMNMEGGLAGVILEACFQPTPFPTTPSPPHHTGAERLDTPPMVGQMQEKFQSRGRPRRRAHPARDMRLTRPVPSYRTFLVYLSHFPCLSFTPCAPHPNE